MLLLMITTDCAAVMILCIAECGAKHASTHGDDGLGCWLILRAANDPSASAMFSQSWRREKAPSWAFSG